MSVNKSMNTRITNLQDQLRSILLTIEQFGKNDIIDQNGSNSERAVMKFIKDARELLVTLDKKPTSYNKMIKHLDTLIAKWSAIRDDVEATYIESLAVKKESCRTPIDFAEALHSATDFATFESLTRQYAETINCTVNESELQVLNKVFERRGVFFCPCVMFNEDLIETYRCPCKGVKCSANKGHLADINDHESCYCKLYIKNE